MCLRVRLAPNIDSSSGLFTEIKPWWVGFIDVWVTIVKIKGLLREIQSTSTWLKGFYYQQWLSATYGFRGGLDEVPLSSKDETFLSRDATPPCFLYSPVQAFQVVVRVKEVGSKGAVIKTGNRQQIWVEFEECPKYVQAPKRRPDH